MNSSYNTTYSTAFSKHFDQFWVQSLIAGSSEAEVGVYVMFDDATQQITHQTGIIVSHREYTHEDYSNSIDSRLNIEVNRTLHLTLFVFDIELEEKSYDCFDYLQVNGNYTYGKTCDEKILPGELKTFVMSDGKFRISFHTDGSVQQKGFLIYFQLTGEQKLFPSFT